MSRLFGIYVSGFIISEFTLSYNDAVKASKKYLERTNNFNKRDEFEAMKTYCYNRSPDNFFDSVCWPFFIPSLIVPRAINLVNYFRK